MSDNKHLTVTATGFLATNDAGAFKTLIEYAAKNWRSLRGGFCRDRRHGFEQEDMIGMLLDKAAENGQLTNDFTIPHGDWMAGDRYPDAFATLEKEGDITVIRDAEKTIIGVRLNPSLLFRIASVAARHMEQQQPAVTGQASLAARTPS